MEEIEKRKMVRVKTDSDSKEIHQIMTAIVADTIREIVRISNEEGIKRENIVSLLKENGQFVLVYYK